MAHSADPEKPAGGSEKPAGGRSLAFWAAVYAFFGNVVAIKFADVFVGGDVRIGIGALLTSFCVAGGVYAKQRLDEAKAERKA